MRGAGAQRGRDAEVSLANELAEAGWLVGSRRHITGPGDLLAVYPGRVPLLIEVKTTSYGPFDRFGPEARKALQTAAADSGALAILAWRKPGMPTWKMLAAGSWPEMDRVHKHV